MGVRTLVDRLERAEGLDRIGDPVSRAVRRVLRGRAADLLHGEWLGHTLHPALVQAPVGAWLSTAVLDAMPGTRRPARVLTAIGVVSALPAALAGINDWARLSPEMRRVGLVHWAGNLIGIGLYAGSWAARAHGRHGLGRSLAYAGVSAAGASAYLGGHLGHSPGACEQVAVRTRTVSDRVPVAVP